MSILFPRDAAPFIATSRKVLKDRGIELKISNDFEEYAEIIAAERPSQKLGLPFDPAKTKLNRREAFWLIARTTEGRLLHSQAFKRIHLGNQALSGYLLKRFRDFPPPIPGVDFERSRYRATPGAHRVRGHVVYHGDFWIDPEDGLFRGTGLSTVLARSGMLEVMRRWNPDYICGFILRQVAFKGFSQRIGYFHNEPGALEWHIAGREQPLEAFLTYLSEEDAKFLLDMPVEHLVTQAA